MEIFTGQNLLEFAEPFKTDENWQRIFSQN